MLWHGALHRSRAAIVARGLLDAGRILYRGVGRGVGLDRRSSEEAIFERMDFLLRFSRALPHHLIPDCGHDLSRLPDGKDSGLRLLQDLYQALLLLVHGLHFGAHLRKGVLAGVHLIPQRHEFLRQRRDLRYDGIQFVPLPVLLPGHELEPGGETNLLRLHLLDYLLQLRDFRRDVGVDTGGGLGRGRGDGTDGTVAHHGAERGQGQGWRRLDLF
mmetsp:Transcript_3744/g.7833  ORF Transcript_3744/g.7833 Transcript_3744/m.7833 type:complete len:215 (-) Transcript_3744:1745-2389(-)